MRFCSLILLASLAAGPAQARSLYWERLDVNARLDADGRLHVAETQAIVFDGEWNGGERRFDIRPGQSLSLEGMTRIDNGREISMRQGDVNVVDGYKMFDGDVLRWRSRLPSDPPFRNTPITYRIDYTISGVVQHAGSEYALGFDSVFPDRSGTIKHFTLHLELDPAWGSGVVDLRRDDLAPGASVVVDRQLTYRGAGTPAAVPTGISRGMSLGIAVLFMVAVAAMIAVFVKKDAATGRLAPLQPPQSINAGWLEQNLFTLSPEVAGAAWDTDVGAPEVAAVLARMAAEKKIASEVKKPEGFFAGKPVLHLRLLVERSELDGYERALVGKLFFNSRKETDTKAIQEHYKSTGLDLAALIKPHIEEKLQKLPRWHEKDFKAPFASDVLVAVTMIGALIALGVMGNQSDVVYATSSGIAGGICLVIALVAAGLNRRKITAVVRRYTLVLALLSPILLLELYYILEAGAHLVHGPSVIAQGLWALAVLKLVLDTLRIPDAPETIAFRKTIASARQYFAHELRSSAPHLQDEWLPYLLAFGLGTNVDAWFRSMGAATAAATSHSSFGSSSSIASSSSGWTGGGGTFGGAGATGAWTVAAGALAAGVSAPSSSSSGGGGGSSSGGGGGGGW